MASFTGKDLRRRVEPGRIVLTVGLSAGDPGSCMQVTIDGDARVVDHTRTMSTRATVLTD